MPQLEVFANQPTGTVTAGGTTTGSTAFTVTTTDVWPAASATASPANVFRIVDVANTSEIMLVTVAPGGSGSGQSWTVTRGAEGTTAIAHAANWTCQQVITAGTLQGFKQTPGATVSAVTVNSTTETALAVYQPLSTQLVTGASFEAIAFGSIQRLGTTPTGSTIKWQLRWGWVSSATPGTSVLALTTGTNGPAVPTTILAGSSFDVNGNLTLLSATSAVANLNFWFNGATSVTTTDTYVASNGTGVTISGSGPLALTCTLTTLGTSEQLVAPAPMIYQAA